MSADPEQPPRARLRALAKRVVPASGRERLHRLNYTAGLGLRLQVMFMTGRLPSATLRDLIYRAMGLSLGEEAHIYRGLEIRDPKAVKIGRGSIVGFDCILDGRGGLSIGEHVNLSSQVAIWTLAHDHRSPTFDIQAGPVHIGDRVWLSFRSTVLGGVTIGEGAVVMAGAVVTRDVEPWTVVGGIPARKVAERPRVGYEFSAADAHWFV